MRATRTAARFVEVLVVGVVECWTRKTGRVAACRSRIAVTPKRLWRGILRSGAVKCRSTWGAFDLRYDVRKRRRLANNLCAETLWCRACFRETAKRQAQFGGEFIGT